MNEFLWVFDIIIIRPYIPLIANISVKQFPNAIPMHLSFYLIYPSTPHYPCLIPLPRHSSFHLISFPIHLLLNSSRWCLAGSLGAGSRRHAVQSLEGSVDLLVVLLHCADHLLNEGAALSGGGGGGGAVAGLCGCHCDCFVCLFVLVVCVKRG
jgi:hypothetical protein